MGKYGKDYSEECRARKEPTDSDDAWFTVMRPYPHIICKAARPDECLQEDDGYCPKCHIQGFHAGRNE